MDGYEIILGIDVNLDQQTDRIFQQFLSSYNLIDILKSWHCTPTATHKVWNRLDIVAGSQYLYDNTLAAGFLYEIDGAPLDHASLSLNFNNIKFEMNTDLIETTTRSFTSCHENSFKNFGKTVDKKLCNNTLLDSLLRLLETATLVEKQDLYNHINEIIVMEMLKEEYRLAT